MKRVKKHIAFILCLALYITLFAPINMQIIKAEGESEPEITITIGDTEYVVREERVITDFNDFDNDMDGENNPAPWGVSNRKTGENNIIGEKASDRDDVSGKFVTKTSGNLLMTRYFNTENSPLVTGKVLLETQIRVEDKSAERRILIVRDNSKALKNTILFKKDGKITMTGQEIAEYETEKWYHIQMVLDNDAGKIKLYIDDVDKGTYDFDTNGGMQETRIVQVGANNVEANMYVDDIKIIELTDKSDPGEPDPDPDPDPEEPEPEPDPDTRIGNLIENGGFETVVDEDDNTDETEKWDSTMKAIGWVPWKPTGKPRFYLDNEIKYEGDYSVRIEAEGDVESRGSFGGPLVEVYEGTKYVISVKMKTENITQARFRVASHDKDEVQLPYEHIKFAKTITDTTDWQDVYLVYEVPKNIGAKYIRVALFMEKGTGKVWFDDVRVERYVPVTEISIGENRTIKIGESFQIEPVIQPEDGNRAFVWSSSNNDIVTVKDGYVQGVGIGETTITVKYAHNSQVTDSICVTVEKDPSAHIPVTGITLQQESLQLEEKKYEKLQWIITPADASDPRVRFESENPEIAKVLEDGTVIGVKAGETVIKAITVEGNYEASCTVTVTPYIEDEFDQMREKWKQMTLGTPYNSEDEKIKVIIAKNDEEARGYWDTLNKASNRTFLWEKLKDSANNPEQIRSMYSNLFSMAKAYKMPGSLLYGNQELLGDIIDALDWLHINRYHEGKQAYGNWWPWEIGVPVTLNDIVVLLYDELSPIQIKNYMDAIEYFQPDPRYSGANAKGTTSPNFREATGANRVDVCKVVAVRGCIVKDGGKIALSRDALSQVFEYVTVEDGFYKDGSFIQHENIPYTGTYGNVLISGVATLLQFLHQTTWEVTDPNVENIYKSVVDSFEPLLYKGAVMDMVSGRAIARPNGDHGKGRAIINSILGLADSAPDIYLSLYKPLVKFMILEDTFEPYFEKIGNIGLYNKAKEIVEDPQIKARESYIKHVKFPCMDRVVHHRPGYAFGISSHSKRVGNYEAMSNENMKGWYTGDGMTYLYNEDLGHYKNYWPTVNPYRMPGTTEDTEARQNNSGQRRFFNRDKGMSSKSWVGGVSLDRIYGIWGMDFESWDESLTAKKSWFMFDDEIVALGAGITSGKEGVSVETTIENRKLKEEGTNVVTFGNFEKEQILNTDSEQNIGKAIWAHLEGNVPGADIGYYFPEAHNIYAIQEKREGCYKDIHQSGSPEPLENHYFTIWVDHGSKPENAQYQYVLLPNKTLEETKNYASKSDIVILANNESVQAVKDKNLNIIGANFWEDTMQKVDVITSHNKTAVMLKESKGMLDVAVSDPTMDNNGTIELEIDKTAYKILHCDSRITVTQMNPTIKIQADVNDTKGQDLLIRLQTEKPEEPGEPGDPDEPEDPEDPDEPEDPEDPDEPEDPEDPDEPEDPEEPEEPEEPEPSKPKEPDKLEEPKPSKPKEPDKPEEPEPSKPKKPDKPEESSKPPKTGKDETSEERSFDISGFAKFCLGFIYTINSFFERIFDLVRQIGKIFAK